eukprot:1162028-Pelagomonas_calceolata.AAC.15
MLMSRHLGYWKEDEKERLLEVYPCRLKSRASAPVTVQCMSCVVPITKDAGTVDAGRLVRGCSCCFTVP